MSDVLDENITSDLRQYALDAAHDDEWQASIRAVEHIKQAFIDAGWQPPSGAYHDAYLDAIKEGLKKQGWQPPLRQNEMHHKIINLSKDKSSQRNTTEHVFFAERCVAVGCDEIVYETSNCRYSLCVLHAERWAMTDSEIAAGLSKGE